MTLTDPIADMLTRIRNALMARKEDTLVPASRLAEEIARILRDEGFIHGYELVVEGPHRYLRIILKYTETGRPVLTGLKRISTPGRRIYVRKQDIPRVKGGLGFAILSTSRGVMTGEDALRAGVGGEVICYVW